MNEDFPSIEQIIAKADTLGGCPMSDDESREWFNQTVDTNRRRKLDAAEGKKG